MRRADRLFQIVQQLRRRRVTTAARLAEELEVSERTIYRDIRDLIASGVPIEGEAGVGYALPRGFDLPPLMFQDDEIEALVLGARMVASWSDPSLVRAAERALARIEAALPERLRPKVAESALFAPSFHVPEGATAHLAALRAAVSERRKLRFGYTRADGARSTRTVHPLGLFFWGTGWSLAAWCELRAEFRGFRLDRIHDLETLDARFEETPGQTLRDFFLYRDAETERNP
ncbi:DeoR family transcriptional regulator [Sorangium cellulosum]|uniref:DeoR family transcriptional regulator n=1 Tax=Sorangium cellulosum TaxID=56 RepID=A0A2L0F211_SORCE|nr:YafY family protein [Sorangium cellulosum]AUX45531.1 DeoR family transcriptional regulator [Sorangium cellulosum]